MHSFYTATGARLHVSSAPQPPTRPAASFSRTAEIEVTGHHGTAPGPQRYSLTSAVSGASEPLALGTAATTPSPSACRDGASDGQVHGGDPAPSDTTGEEDSEAEQPEAEQSYSDWARKAADELMAQRRRAADARREGAAATLPGERRHDISRVPTPWGVTPQQDALRGVITSYDSDGRCSYVATHK